MNVAVVGFARDGQAALTYWQAKGDTVTICDQDEHITVPAGVTTQLGADYLKDLGKFDLIVRTSGLHPGVILAENPGVEAKITTAIDEFMRVCPTPNIIGITGTKGKGTTSTLISKMLEAAGKQVVLAGNIGIPALDLLHEVTPESWVVLELSSFQLFDIKHSPHIGVCLMVVPEHLNWHDDIQDYAAAKRNMFVRQKPDDIAIYFADNELSHSIASASPGAKISYFAEPGAYVTDGGDITIDASAICHVDELKLLGKHNWQNACAAVTAAWQVTKDVAALRSVLTTFGGLEHRLEFVREVDGIKYYNDSFGTTPETAIVAIEAFKEPKVVILGGSDKGADFTQLAKTVAASNVRQVIAIGDTGPAIADALRAEGFNDIINGGTTMAEIIDKARGAAQHGDVVLLSTGCASFGLFKDYKDRGIQFKTAVGAL